MNIEHARKGDAAELLAYLEQVAAESDNLSFGPGELGMTLEQEQAFIEAMGELNLMLLAKDAGKIVATCSIMRVARPRMRHIGELGISVAKSHWGQGIGRALINQAMALAKQRGVTKVWLRVRDDNARAIKLYESIGFKREGIMERALRVRGVYVTDLTMGLNLD